MFQNLEPFKRLNAVRIWLCTIVMILLVFGPYDSFYVDTSSFLFYSTWFPNLHTHFWTLKYIVLLSAFCFACGLAMRVSGPTFALSFLMFNYYVTCFQTSYWVTNTHLNFFALFLAIVPFVKCRKIASYLVTFMISYVATLYLQAGVSKCMWGGFDWFWTGQRIWTETLLLGTPFGKWLTQWPSLFTMMGLATFVIECIVPFFFFFERFKRHAAVVAILFHLGTFCVMGISFWFLWALYPALFFKKFQAVEMIEEI